jgi:hypothetical protein
MAYSLTARADELLNGVNVEPNLILTIDGYDRIFAISIAKIYTTIGMSGLTIGGGWVIGGLSNSSNCDEYISLEGTTTNISQQLDLDKNNASGTQTVKVRLVDINSEITRLISPNFELDDILYKNATIRLGFKDGAYPEDYVDLFLGKIQQIDASTGYVELTIAHPEELKRSEIFPKIETTLAADLNYYSAVVQDLTWYQQGDFNGIAEVRYINTPFIGDNANVSVSGNLITVSIDSGVTKAKTIRETIINSIQASSIAVPVITGNKDNVQVTHPTTQLSIGSTVDVEDISGFLLPAAPMFRTYLRINDELMEYTGIDTANNRFTGVTRHVLTSVGNNHKIDDTVSSFYKLGDNTEDSNALDLALKVMISGSNQSYISDLSGVKFYDFGTGSTYPNGVLVLNKDLKRDYNIQIGDLIDITNATNVANNVSSTIEDYEIIDIGTIIYVTGASFVTESGSAAKVSIDSKYNTLPSGCGFVPFQVDIDRFNLVKERFPSSIANYEIYLKDTVKPKDFINIDLFLPSALYSIPRQGKASVGISAPPLYETDSNILNIDTVKNVKKLKTTRSINKYFYNSVIFKYNEDSIDDRSLNGRIVYSADSQNRINAPNKPYTINAKGLRPSAQNDQLIERNCKRLLQRYQYGAETIPVEPDFKTGYTMEVGDSVIFGDGEIQLSDSQSGDRNFKPRVFEIVNKEFDWRAGAIKLNIVDTNFSSGVRYGVWSPASNVVSGSTTTKIKIQDSFGSDSDKDKWTPYFNKTIRVRSQDYLFTENVKLLGFDPADDHAMLVSAISIAPSSGYIVDVPLYDDLNAGADALYKAVHPFWTPTVTLPSGSVSYGNNYFYVSAGDIGLFFVNAIVRVRSEDYSVDTGGTIYKVTSVNTVTRFIGLNADIGFSANAGYKIDLIGFVSDEGNPYCWL